jgi:hypothetical protein
LNTNTIVLFTCFFFLLTSLLITGLLVRYVAISAENLQSLKNNVRRADAIEEHKKYVDRFLFMLLVTVGCVRALVWAKGGLWGDATLFTFHLGFVSVWVAVILSMRFIWVGKKWPETHRWLSYSFFAFGACVLCTAGILLFQMFLF